MSVPLIPRTISHNIVDTNMLELVFPEGRIALMFLGAGGNVNPNDVNIEEPLEDFTL